MILDDILLINVMMPFFGGVLGCLEGDGVDIVVIFKPS